MFHIHRAEDPGAAHTHRHLHIPHPHLPEPHPVYGHREPGYFERSRMGREMGHL